MLNKAKTMDNQIEIKTTAAESFASVYNFLDKIGQSGFFIKPKTKFLNFCYQLYRVSVCVVIFIYTALHITFVALAWGDMDKVLEGASLAFPHMNCCVKCITLNLGTSRLRKMFTLLNDPIFDADNENCVKLLAENKKFAHNLHGKFLNIITFTVTMWVILFVIKKIQDDNAFVPAYFPFETKSWKGYMLGVILELLGGIWLGYGHVTIDVIIVTYYAQARTQLKIIRSNLENLCGDQSHIFNGDQSSEEDDVRIGVNKQYIDDLDENVYERFVKCVKRYEKVVWYTNEVTEIFSTAILFQFFSIALPICTMVIKLSTISIGSMEFLFYVLLIIIEMTQVFLYCYFGGLVIYESNLITRSLYLSQWETLSPKFRRLILIAAERWRAAIKPRVAYIIPLSVDTFISIVKSVYTLFTVLKTANVNIN